MPVPIRVDAEPLGMQINTWAARIKRTVIKAYNRYQ